MKKPILLLILIIVSFCIILISCKAQERYAPYFKCSNLLAEPYGICSHINRTGIWDEFDTKEQDLSMMDSIGANFVRTDFDWVPMKTDDGPLNFQQLDSMVHSVVQHRRDILGILTVDKRNYVSDDWLKYVDETCRRYRNRIIFWEMLNEEEYIYKYVPGFYANQYVEFLKKGYKAVKRANNKAIVLFSGVANINIANVDTIFSQNVNSFFDIMNIHAYTWQDTEPEGLIDYYKDLKACMSKYKINKPVWLTETGVSTYQGGGVSEIIQSERVPRIYLISLALGIEKVFWYKSRSCEMRPSEKEDHFGIWHKDYTPKPAYYTYKTLTWMCPNKSTRPRLERYGSIYVASWKRPDKKNVWALWTSKKRETVDVDISGNFEVYDIKGDGRNANPRRMDISPSVTYVVGASKLSIKDI